MTIYSNINLVSITTSSHLKNAKTRLYVRNTRMKDKGKKEKKKKLKEERKSTCKTLPLYVDPLANNLT